jgi:hypothetical protein
VIITPSLAVCTYSLPGAGHRTQSKTTLYICLVITLSLFFNSSSQGHRSKEIEGQGQQRSPNLISNFTDEGGDSLSFDQDDPAR